MGFITLRDTLVNFVSGLGTQKDPRTGNQWMLQLLDRSVLETMYRSDWLAKIIVDAPAEDATKEWRAWQANDKQIAAIGACERKLQVQKKMQMALIRARLYGGAALVMGVDQGQPEDELDLEDIGKDDLEFVVVLNRYELNAGPRIYNVNSPYYTRPEYYQIATPMFGFMGEQGGAWPGSQIPVSGFGRDPAGRFGASPPPVSYGKDPPGGDKSRQWVEAQNPVYIHPSRVIEFYGNELPDWRLAPMGGGWGDSVLQTVEDALSDFAMIVGGLASMINDAKMDVVKLPELSRKMSTPELTNKLLQRFTLANTAKSSINTLLLDKEEEWNRIQTSFGSTPELIRVVMQIVCAAGGIPQSRAMGSAPARGLDAKGSSGGEVDIRNYYDSIAADQRTRYKPLMHPLDVAIQSSALGKYDPDIDYIWNPLYKPTPAEKAQAELQKAQTTQVYSSLGLFNDDMFRQSVASQISEDDIYPGWDDAADEFGLKPEEPQQQMRQLPTPPPGMMNKGQFEANPFHMMRAQQMQQAGLPIRAPPGRALPPSPMPQQGGGRFGKDAAFEDYNPDEPRDPKGEWTSGGGGSFSKGDTVGKLSKLHGGPLSRDEIKGLGKYTEEGYKRWNRALRGQGTGKSYMSQADARGVADTDKAIRRSKLQNDTLLYRGLMGNKKLSSKTLTQALGKVVQMKGFTSATTKQAVAYDYAFGPHAGEHIVFHIHAEKGQSAFDTHGTNFRHSQDFKSGMQQHEVILPRGVKFRIDGVHAPNQEVIHLGNVPRLGRKTPQHPFVVDVSIVK
jgi:hypothetical protein